MAKETESISQNFNQQFEEEKRKYKLCSTNSNWKDVISKYEDEVYFEGRIKFLLDYSGDSLESFKQYADRAIVLLKDKDCLFERLLLNQEGSSYPCQLENMPLSEEKKMEFHIKTVKQYTFSNKGKSNRDFGWHRLLNDKPDDYKDQNQRMNSLKACQEAAKAIICNNQPLPKEITPCINIEEWKRILIKCPKLIKYCTNTIMYCVTYNDDVCYYLSTDKRNHLFAKRNKISELYTRYLYEKIEGEGNGWEYVTWSYKDGSTAIDPYLKKGNIEIRRKGNRWQFNGLEDIDNNILVDDLAREIVKLP